MAGMLGGEGGGGDGAVAHAGKAKENKKNEASKQPPRLTPWCVWANLSGSRTEAAAEWWQPLSWGRAAVTWASLRRRRCCFRWRT